MRKYVLTGNKIKWPQVVFGIGVLVCVLLCYGEWELRNIEITGNQKKIKHFVSGTTKDND